MSTLLGYLSKFTDSKQPRIHSYGAQVQSTLTFKAVAKQANALRAAMSEVAGARVALTMSATVNSLVHLVAMDGFVNDLILLPVDHQVPNDCHFHITERGNLRKLNAYQGDSLPAITQWNLLDKTDSIISYELNDLAANELVATGSEIRALCWGVMQEPAQLAGLLVWLRALKNGEDLVLAQANKLSALVTMFAQAGVSAIAAPPRLWRNFIVAGNMTSLPLQLAIVNGGLVDEPTLIRLQKVFAGAHIAHSFSNTGAGVNWLINDGKPGLPETLFEQHTESKALLEFDQGRLNIAVNGTGTTIPTKFLAEQAADGRVHLVGHIDSQVVVGGREVSPEQVEIALLQIPEVSDVQASGVPDPVLGEIIRVDVLAPSQRTVAERKVFKRKLQAHCRAMLEPWQRPARYYFY